MMHRFFRPTMDAPIGLFVTGDARCKDVHVAFDPPFEDAAAMPLLPENADAAKDGFETSALRAMVSVAHEQAASLR